MRTRAYNRLRKTVTVRYQCPYCNRISTPGGKRAMDRHVRWQDATSTGRTNQYSGCRLAMELKKRASGRRILRRKEAFKVLLPDDQTLLRSGPWVLLWLLRHKLDEPARLLCSRFYTPRLHYPAKGLAYLVTAHQVFLLVFSSVPSETIKVPVSVRFLPVDWTPIPSHHPARSLPSCLLNPTCGRTYFSLHPFTHHVFFSATATTLQLVVFILLVHLW